MSGKSAKVAAMVAGLEPGPWDPRYIGWFECFNRGEYYEAHDVLEDLWLEQGKAGANHSFYKGLIQFAGAFVHLQKNRLGPALALLRLAEVNFQKYPAHYEGVDLHAILRLLVGWRGAIMDGEGKNPLGPDSAPHASRPSA